MALKEYDFEKEPTISVVKNILTDSIKMKASDIHFDPRSKDLLIKFRINGNLTEYTTAPENVKTNILTRVKILAGMNITDSVTPQIGTINFELENSSTNMRVSTLPVMDGEKIVVHIANYAGNIKSISKIGIVAEDVEKIKKLIKEPQGILLITGTSSSGKTTTMYSLLKELNSKATNIISIEDPVKMKIEGINQVQIAPERGLSYRKAIKSALLQDPNIICINELVDDETARNALRASITGRLVISTMHTKSAYTTIDTLLNMDVENYLLGSNLLGIISQRLVKKLCPSCREKRAATDYEKTVIKEILGEDIKELYYQKGCNECQNGYIDQIPVVEVVEIDDKLRNAISNNKDRDELRNIIYSKNNSLLKDGLKKAINGDTTFAEIIKITDVKTDFKEDEESIKEYILGNGKTSLTELKEKNKIKKEEEIQQEQQPKQEEQNIEEVNNDVKDFSNITNETKNEPVIKEETNNINTKVDSTPENKPTEQKTSTMEQILKGNIKRATVDKQKTEETPKKEESTAKVSLATDDDENDFNYGDSFNIF